MIKRSQAVASGIGVAALLGISLAFAPAANAASIVPAPNPPSDKPIYVLDPGTGVQAAENTSYHWNDDFFFSPDPQDQNAVFTAPAGSANQYEFISPRGSERNKAAWNAYVKIGTTGNIGAFDGIVSGLASGNAAATPGTTVGVATTGGDYALGIAYLNSTGTVIEADYVNVTFTANATPQNATFQFSGGASSVTAPTITTASLNGFITGTAFTQTLAASGTAPITWSVQAGALPAGINLDATTGTLSGTPTASGPYTVTVRAANSAGTNDKVYSGSVAASAPTQPAAGAPNQVTITDPAKGATTVTVPAGAANANKTLEAWAWSTPTDLGSVTTDASGNATVNIAGLPAGVHTVALTQPGDATFGIVAWGTFTKTANTGDPISKTVDLSANVTASDLWSLEAANTTVDFGDVQRGVTKTAALGKLTVVDDRSVLKGWDLDAAWTNFTKGTDSIDASALTITPKAFAGYTPIAGVTVDGPGTKIAHSSAVSTGTTGALFDADLAFTAPANAQAGEYHSTLTVTLTSK